MIYALGSRGRMAKPQGDIARQAQGTLRFSRPHRHPPRQADAIGVPSGRNRPRERPDARPDPGPDPRGTAFRAHFAKVPPAAISPLTPRAETPSKRGKAVGWRRGYAPDCKSVKTGSIPVPASISFNDLADMAAPRVSHRVSGCCSVPVLFIAVSPAPDAPASPAEPRPHISQSSL